MKILTRDFLLPHLDQPHIHSGNSKAALETIVSMHQHRATREHWDVDDRMF